MQLLAVRAVLSHSPSLLSRPRSFRATITGSTPTATVRPRCMKGLWRCCSPRWAFREAVFDDIPAIEQLQQDSRGNDRWVGRKLEEEFVNEVASITLAEAQGENGGVKLIAMALAWHVAGETQLLELCVAKAARRRGVAAALLQHVMEAGGGGPVMLEVRASNSAAIALYEKAGFQMVGRRRGYYSDGEDALLMNLSQA